MSEVFVVGAGMIPMGKYRDVSYAGLAIPAVLGALEVSGVEAGQIEEVFCASSFGGMLVGQRITKAVGIGGVPVTNVENACSGGATAIHLGYEAIRAGERDIVLAVGVEKLTQFGGGPIPLVAEDPEVRQGLVMPALYAMRAMRYLHERDAQPADLAAVAVKARRHGAKNPYAQFQREVTVDEVLGSRPISDPLTLLQCCPTGDGAAAVVLVSERVRAGIEQAALRVRASVLHSGTFEGGARDMLTPEISASSARDAYEMSGIGPDDLDMIELHDAFTVAELVYYEALGLCARGDSLDLLRSGATTFGGAQVVNPSGGLLSKGHPVGASGVAQVVEAFWQLTGSAGPARQVPDARLAMTHVTGGGISGYDHASCAIHVFEADHPGVR